MGTWPRLRLLSWRPCKAHAQPCSHRLTMPWPTWPASCPPTMRTWPSLRYCGCFNRMLGPSNGFAVCGQFPNQFFGIHDRAKRLQGIIVQRHCTNNQNVNKFITCNFRCWTSCWMQRAARHARSWAGTMRWEDTCWTDTETGCDG